MTARASGYFLLLDSTTQAFEDYNIWQSLLFLKQLNAIAYSNTSFDKRAIKVGHYDLLRHYRQLYHRPTLPYLWCNQLTVKSLPISEIDWLYFNAFFRGVSLLMTLRAAVTTTSELPTCHKQAGSDKSGGLFEPTFGTIFQATNRGLMHKSTKNICILGSTKQTHTAGSQSSSPAQLSLGILACCCLYFSRNGISV